MENIKTKKIFSKIAISMFAFAVLMTSALPASADDYAPQKLVPMGNAIGINVCSMGAVVVNVEQLQNKDGVCTPAQEAGIRPGDIIIGINNKCIESADDVRQATKKLDGTPVTIKVSRYGHELSLSLTPRENENGDYKLGVWLRDSLTGMGTMTFYDPNTGIFASLGHPVSDIDTGIILPLRTGNIMNAAVTSIIIGQPGIPGQIQGMFDLNKSAGVITKNTSAGIFGKVTDTSVIPKGEAIPVAEDNEIVPGKAVILSNLQGTEIKEYDIEITRVHYGFGTDGRNLMIKVTDGELLGLTGGIVQGMSGSPIIQNGKLIGAVTHVLINNPTRGYGISINKMLQSAYDIPANKAA